MGNGLKTDSESSPFGWQCSLSATPENLKIFFVVLHCFLVLNYFNN